MIGIRQIKNRRFPRNFANGPNSGKSSKHRTLFQGRASTALGRALRVEGRLRKARFGNYVTVALIE